MNRKTPLHGRCERRLFLPLERATKFFEADFIEVGFLFEHLPGGNRSVNGAIALPEYSKMLLLPLQTYHRHERPELWLLDCSFLPLVIEAKAA
jgi:hypothetical protein